MADFAEPTSFTVTFAPGVTGNVNHFSWLRPLMNCVAPPAIGCAATQLVFFVETGRQYENSDVSLTADDDVAVAEIPIGSFRLDTPANVWLNTALPVASVVTGNDPSNRAPSPNPDESQTPLA